MSISLLFLRFCAYALSLCLLTCNTAEGKLATESDAIGMDFLIISTSTQEQQEYWEKQLNSLRGSLIKSNAYVMVIHEQWPGGAGSGFGTFYAYQQAQLKAKELYGIDLIDFQNQGHAVAIYHTSGQGKRMSPLTASEKNNKSAVKLPTGLPFADHSLSILEAVIWQSASLAPIRQGRVSVFWGDQIFLPKQDLKATSQYEIDIFAKSRPMPSGIQWQADGLDKYGFFTSDLQGASCYLEKATFGTIEQLIKNQKISGDNRVAISIGSFSLSSAMMSAFLEEFASELCEKNEMLNVEHSLWMPLTLDLATYTMFMESMGWSKERSHHQHKRLTAFKERFLVKHPEVKLFGITDIGEDGYWWDYGTIDNYFDSLQKLTKQGEEADAMRAFYQIPARILPLPSDRLQIDATSIVLKSSIESGQIRNSIVIGVTAKSVDFENSIAISSSFNAIEASNSLYYNVIEDQVLFAGPKSVRADLFLKESTQPIKISTQLGRDGKADWETRLEGNRFSYAELEKMNLAGD